MTLADKIAKHAYTNDSCPVAKLAEKLNEVDRKTLFEALDKGVPATTLATALREEGHKIGEPSLNQHRSGKCRCKKS